jgi:hypothetical protein
MTPVASETGGPSCAHVNPIAQMRTFREETRLAPPRDSLIRTSVSLRVAKLHPRVSSSVRNPAWLPLKVNNPAVADFPHGLVAQTPRFHDR